MINMSEKSSENDANLQDDQPGDPNDIKCPKCGSTKWTCFDEQTRYCWDKDGQMCNFIPIGALKCGACNAVWLDYPCGFSTDGCECEDY